MRWVSSGVHNRAMPSGSTLLLFSAASLALLALPGPAVIYVVTRSLDEGRRAGFVSVLGVETGTLTYALAATVGVSGVIAASATAFTAIRYAGAAYLVVLGARKLLARDSASEASLKRRRRVFLNGFLVQLLNPKIALFFVAFLPQFVVPDRGAAPAQMLILGMIFTFLAVLSDGAYALVAGALGGWLRTSRRTQRWLDRASGGVYIGLGITVALAGGSGARAHYR
jgi:threonine/homoserine/homoserine lactone efflux protein